MITETVNSLFWKDENNSSEKSQDIGPLASADQKFSSPPFSLGLNQKNSAIAAANAPIQNELPGFMDLVREGSEQDTSTNKGSHSIDSLDVGEIQGDIRGLQKELDNLHHQVRSQSGQGQLDAEHYEAGKGLMANSNQDFKEIAAVTKQQHDETAIKALEEDPSTPFLDKFSDWMTSGEKTLAGALSFISDPARATEQASMADFLKLQYAVQRATQKTELFAGIVGAVVTGIKTLMTTQLG
ncbi:Uncharacterized protein CLAVI_000285 [Candidatus Clavichlamydia salmonicola]|uniref:hypothetical protein n=1 Tax=Candidatus Clavichlamydia salmonicola TaxID=469812 RepID=UPI001890D975|nr:hypothetical protein [Candidatus Clavichlamydia salmonicola]MBF5050670.1 Uncharacterized protein [Candidatus Clavichlamydia salmonicola]